MQRKHLHINILNMKSVHTFFFVCFCFISHCRPHSLSCWSLVILTHLTHHPLFLPPPIKLRISFWAVQDMYSAFLSRISSFPSSPCCPHLCVTFSYLILLASRLCRNWREARWTWRTTRDSFAPWWPCMRRLLEFAGSLLRRNDEWDFTRIQRWIAHWQWCLNYRLWTHPFSSYKALIIYHGFSVLN
jgi:hypothetical protein